jgi:hypothetical protein
MVLLSGCSCNAVVLAWIDYSPGVGLMLPKCVHAAGAGDAFCEPIIHQVDDEPLQSLHCILWFVQYSAQPVG